MPSRPKPTPRPLATGLVLLVLALHAVAAVAWLPRLSFHADLAVESDQDPRVAASLIREQAFPGSKPLVFLVDGGGRDELVQRLGERELGVRSAEGTRDQQTPLQARLFLTPDRLSWVVYVPTQDDGQVEAALVADLPDQMPGLRVGGAPWVRYLLDRALAVNLAWLMPGALTVLLLIFGALTRRLGTALLLTGLSCLPALGVVLLFPALGLAFNFTTILAPLLTLALATTYTLHIDHHLREHGPGWKSLLEHRGQAVFWSATISALGFSSLWFSPLPSLRFLGMLLVAGLGLTLFWVLVAFPVLARAFTLRRQVLPPLRLGHPKTATRWTLTLVWALSLAGLVSLSTALHWSDYLGPSTTESRALTTFEQAFPTWQEASLHLSWSEEGGWLEADRWKALEELVSRWKARDSDLNLWSVQDAVSGVRAGQDMDLAEAMEFLPPIQETGKLIDGRRSELVVKFGVPASRIRHLTDASFAQWEAEAVAALPGVKAGWSGPLYRQVLGMQSFLLGELQGMGAFYLLTLLLITIRLRSLRRGLFAVLPAFLTGAFFLGLAGWLGWPISPATALVAAACLGQSTDDGLLWSLLPPTVEVRSSLAESTLLLTGGLSVLLFSSFTNIAQAGFLVILSLCFSTAMVLWFLPWRSRS